MRARLCRGDYLGAECLPSRPATCSVLCDGAVTNIRLIGQVCGCSTVRYGGGSKVRARLCRWCSDGECLQFVRGRCGSNMRARFCRRDTGAECLPPRPATCSSTLQRSRHAPSTDQASWLVLHCAKRRRTQGACLSLPLALEWKVPVALPCNLRLLEGACGCFTVLCINRSKLRARLYRGTRMQSACRRDQPPAAVLCNGAAMNVRLIEQAGGCTTVRGEGEHKVRARLCR